VAKRPPKARVSELDILRTPVGFVQGILGLDLYDWQAKALTALSRATGRAAKRVKVTLLAPNGSGKSERVMGPAGLWWLGVHKIGRAVFTSKDSKQLNEQIVPAVEKHLSKLQGWKSVDSPYFKVTSPTGGTAHYFVTDEAYRLEGWHKHDDIDGPLLMGLDECKGIKDQMFDAVNRCTWNALIYASSGGIKQGMFYKSHTELRNGFTCIQAGLKDCPHIPKDKIADIIRMYGEEHPFTRSSVFGEFMDQDEMDRYVITHESLMRCLNSPPQFKPGFVTVFCDFAEGGAENVIASRNGNKIELIACWREHNKMAACGRFIMEFKKLGVKPEQIIGDAADKEMCDLLRDAGWTIRRQNFGSPAGESDVFVSWGAEAWLNLAANIERGELILPKDDELIAQLTSRKKLLTRFGKLGLEDKHDMRVKRGLPSPDRADTVAGVAAQKDYALLTKQPIIRSWQEEYQNEQDMEVLDRIGANAGW
jgi:phage terminase large subunit